PGGPLVTKLTLRWISPGTFLVLLCMVLHPEAYAQSQGSVVGRVFDQTQALIPGVTVDLTLEEARTTQTTLTGGDGTYRFDNVPSGRAEIVFRLINFSTVRRILEIPAGGAVSADVTLVVSSSADITVTVPHTFRNLADLDRPAENIIGVAAASSEGAITPAQLDTRPIMRPGEILETVPGMIVSQHSGDGKANQYYLP